MTCKQEMTQEFKIGDRVKVVRQVPSNDPNGMGSGLQWCNSWIDSMDKFIGKEGVITYVDNLCGIGIGLYSFPSAALELVTEDITCDAPVVQELKELTIKSFLSQMPECSSPEVSTTLTSYTIFIFGDEFVAATEERLQEIMKALLVLYKAG
jgi:hypothetical protein